MTSLNLYNDMSRYNTDRAEREEYGSALGRLCSFCFSLAVVNVFVLLILLLFSCCCCFSLVVVFVLFFLFCFSFVVEAVFKMSQLCLDVLTRFFFSSGPGSREKGARSSCQGEGERSRAWTGWWWTWGPWSWSGGAWGWAMGEGWTWRSILESMCCHWPGLPR